MQSHASRLASTRSYSHNGATLGVAPFVAGTRTLRGLDVEVLHEVRVLFDEDAPRIDLVAHQRLVDLIGEHRLLDGDLEQRATLRIHRRIPELLGVHLAQALVALDVERSAAVAVAEPRRDLFALGLVVG